MRVFKGFDLIGARSCHCERSAAISSSEKAARDCHATLAMTGYIAKVSAIRI